MPKPRGLPLLVEWYNDCGEKAPGAIEGPDGFFRKNEGTLLAFVALNNAAHGIIDSEGDLYAVEIEKLMILVDEDDS